MARQRFIHPEIWKDPAFGRLQPLEQVMFIGLFSIADDEGRTNADPAYLRSELFAYTEFSLKRVQQIRDSVAQKLRSVCLYHADGVDVIALLKWKEYQKPKYPKPSKLPPPLEKASPKLPPTLPQGFPHASPLDWVGLGRDGMDRAVPDSPNVGETAGEQPSDFTAPNLKAVNE